MPFDAKCSDYMGKRLFVLPYYGYGWRCEDSNLALSPTDRVGPEPFNLVINEFVYRGGQVVGAIGKIEAVGHNYDKMWGAFCLRMSGDYNFTTNPGECMVWIGRDRPVAKADSSDAVYHWIELGNASQKLEGYGTVAESKQWIKEIYERTMQTRKELAG